MKFYAVDSPRADEHRLEHCIAEIESIQTLVTNKRVLRALIRAKAELLKGRSQLTIRRKERELGLR